MQSSMHGPRVQLVPDFQIQAAVGMRCELRVDESIGKAESPRDGLPEGLARTSKALPAIFRRLTRTNNSFVSPRPIYHGGAVQEQRTVRASLIAL